MIVKIILIFSFYFINISCCLETSTVYPEIEGGWYPKKTISTKEFMVVSSDPLATKAGYDIINKGGNAIDALVAVQMVLNLVEPQASGIGGGAFLLYFDNLKNELKSYDGRETAPSQANEMLFYKNGKKMEFKEALVGGRSVGVPGVLKLLKHAHMKHGRLEWRDLFTSAISLAENGFPISHRLALLINQTESLKQDKEAREYFYHQDGSGKTFNEKLVNKKFAKTLELISNEKCLQSSFYNGELAKKIVEKVRSHPTNPGTLSLYDMANYQIKTTTPICKDYSNKWEICSTPPESGGLTMLQILAILDSLPPNNRIDNEKPIKQQMDIYNEFQPTTKSVHIFGEASKLAFSDRNKYLAELDLNWDVFLNDTYLKERANLIKNKSMGVAKAGDFTESQLKSKKSFKVGNSYELPCTTHISILDREGNSVSMTTSIEHGFGSSLMVEGFLLNNQLTDFSFDPHDSVNSSCLVANRVRPNKRPRSSMSPTLIFKKSKSKKKDLIMNVGAGGGPLIPNIVARSILSTLHWNISLQDSFGMPYFGSINSGAILFEKDHLSTSIQDSLINEYGQKLEGSQVATNLVGFSRKDPEDISSEWVGACDPRREGIAMGI